MSSCSLDQCLDYSRIDKWDSQSDIKKWSSFWCSWQGWQPVVMNCASKKNEIEASKKKVKMNRPNWSRRLQDSNLRTIIVFDTKHFLIKMFLVKLLNHSDKSPFKIHITAFPALSFYKRLKQTVKESRHYPLVNQIESPLFRSRMISFRCIVLSV